MQSTTKDETQAERKANRTLKDYIGLAARGFAMGASDVVPGVSGGTMAFILGIYEELINSIRTVGQPEFLQAVFKFRIKEIFEILNWKFLLAVAIGIFSAILTLAPLLENLLENQPVYLWSFFFGLVVASIFAVRKRIKQWTAAPLIALLIGTVGAYFLVGLVPAQTPNTWWFLMLSGAIAICAMILPGISGSFILVLLGKYEFVLSAVNDRDIVSVGFVGLGAVIGIVTIAQLLGWLFKNYHDITVALLIGLMVGSLRKIWPWKEDVEWLRDTAGEFILSDGHRIVTQQNNILPNNGMTEVLIALLLALIGLAAVIVLERLAGED